MISRQNLGRPGAPSFDGQVTQFKSIEPGSLGIGSITKFVPFFSKFERLFKKNMYNSIIQSIAHLKL